MLENPVLSIASAIVALLALLNNVVSSLGLPPFWTDLVLSLILTYTVCDWGFLIYCELFRGTTVVAFEGTTKEAFGVKLRRMMLPIVTFPILFSLLVWTVVPIWRHLGHTNWRICGSFITSCNRNTCLRFTDSRDREVVRGCISVDDDSGYKNFNAPHWWSYEPKNVMLVCNDKASEPLSLDSAFFDNQCDATIAR